MHQSTVYGSGYFIGKVNSIVIAPLFALLVFSCAFPARADVLAEYLFWENVSGMTSDAVNSYNEYAQERQLWKTKIAEAKEELKRCGGCESAQAELDKWQGTEDQFQQVAGSLAASVGMPPVLANALGINMPLAPYQEKKNVQIVRPPWFDELPDYCQSAVDEHLNCLRSAQTKTPVGTVDPGGAMSTIERSPVGMCYDTFKLYEHCASKDYDGYAREMKLRELRASGALIPEYVRYLNNAYVYYGNVPEDFMLPMAPPDVTLDVLADQHVTRVKYVIKTATAGSLLQAAVEEFFWQLVDPDSMCVGRNAAKTGIAGRICSDIMIVQTINPAILTCAYEKGDGTQLQFAYWYGERPTSESEPKDPMSPANLLKHSHHHLLLFIGDPRIECPASFEKAEQIDHEFRMKLASLTGLVEEAPADAELPIMFLAEAQEYTKYLNSRNQYETGDGVKRNFKRARKSYEEGCDKGDVYGCYSAGVMFHEGRGGEQDIPKAYAFYKRACQGGITLACKRASLRQRSESWVSSLKAEKSQARSEAVSTSNPVEASPNKQSPANTIAKQAEMDTASHQPDAQDEKSSRHDQLGKADIAGVRLGMGYEEAERIVRSAMEVGWVVSFPDPEPNGGYNYGIEPNLPYRKVRSFISADGKQQIALYIDQDEGGKVLAVARTSYLSEGTVSELAVAKKLSEKYGEPDIGYDQDGNRPQGGSMIWTADFGNVEGTKNFGTPSVFDFWRVGTCGAGMGENINFKILTGPVDEYGQIGWTDRKKLRVNLPMIEVFGGRDRKNGKDIWDPEAWRHCGPLVVASIINANNGATLTYGLLDLSSYADIYKQQLPQESAGAIPDL